MKNKILILASLLFSGALVMLALFVTSLPTVVKADEEMGGPDNCYTLPKGTYALGTCTCREYMCYKAGTEVWTGGELPTFGDQTKAGTWCDNGYNNYYYSPSAGGGGGTLGEYGKGCFKRSDMD